MRGIATTILLIATAPLAIAVEIEYPNVYQEDLPYIHHAEPEKDGSDRDVAARLVMYRIFVQKFLDGRAPFEHLQLHYGNSSSEDIRSFLEDFGTTLQEVEGEASERKESMVCSGRPADDHAIYARIDNVKKLSNKLIVKAFKGVEKRHDDALVNAFWLHLHEVTDGYTTTTSDPEERNAYYGITDYAYYTSLCGDDE